MEKVDLIIEFHNKIEEIEKNFFKDRYERHEALKNKWNGRKINGDILNFNFKDETVIFPFNHKFYLNGYLCEIQMTGEIKVVE